MTTRVLFAGLFGLCLFAGCTDGALTDLAPDAEGVRVAPPGMAALHAKPVPFVGRFTTDLVSLAPDPARCGPFDPPSGQFNVLNVQHGEGILRRIGPVTVDFEFCVDATDLLSDGVLDVGLPYGPGFGVFTAENGDRLVTTAEGIVRPNPNPGFDYRFKDAFLVQEGTGRFAGAVGEGRFNSVVDTDFVLDDGTLVSRTFHRVTGRLVLVE